MIARPWRGWTAAGIALAAVLAAPPARAAGPAPGRSVAITIDDLPGVARPSGLDRLRVINARIVDALRAAGAPAIGFVNGRGLQVDGERDARAAILAGWIDAGLTLGNHTFSHKGLTATPLAAYEDDVVKGEVVTRDLLEARGGRLVWFRHPFTQTGPTPAIKEAFERFLEDRGMRVAPFTIETADYIFAALHDSAVAGGDPDLAARIETAYLAHTDTMFGWFESLSRDMFGREIPQILLIHDNALNAEALPEMMRRLRARGYRFVGIDEALGDEAYATPDRYVGDNGPSWLHRWTVSRGEPMRLRDEPDPPRWILDAWKQAGR